LLVGSTRVLVSLRLLVSPSVVPILYPFAFPSSCPLLEQARSGRPLAEILEIRRLRRVTMSEDPEVPLRVTGDQRLVEEWELVLLAQGISPTVRRSVEGIVLSVPEGETDRARAALSAYESENPQATEEDEPAGSADSFVASTFAGLLILAFFSVTVLSNPTMSWFERGSADAQKILNGELWRTVTALTLHADVAHALSNVFALALFLGAVSSVLGTGLSCALILLAGAGGNLANALLHGSLHVSVGASTAVFGAVGVLGGVGVVMRRARALGRRRAWLPVAAALALLGMLGTGGGRVDIWAHLSGLLVGGILGILVARVVKRPPELGVQWACGGAAVGMLIYCWTLALR
jgi:membrane associated rhomboid family serine protease